MRSSQTAVTEGRTAAQVALRVRTIRTDAAWRRGLNRSHVAALSETPEAWPPIVVTRVGTTVLDGSHRVAAAKELGLATIQAVFFDGDLDRAFIEFLRLNRSHGLPLTLSERRDAARRLLDRDADRSDRWIAELCGLSPKTVGRVRQTLPVVTPLTVETCSAMRIGRDGRTRPSHPSATRQRIADELVRDPEASFRSIAKTVGASFQTVRSVAQDTANGQATRTPPSAAPTAAFAALPARQSPDVVRIGGDCAFHGEADTARFASLFDSTAVDRRELLRHVESVPRSRVYVVADEARRRAESWQEFAEVLESRVRRRG